jgi:2-polyprenyl-3-methyl-5-hydroxy-6-metoxy-1,4-benzoquinol methylase
MMRCPLCAAPRCPVVEERPASFYVHAWREAFGLDISCELAADVIRRWRCRRCHLEFYDPALAGSGVLYAHLEDFPWYYEAEKWEFSFALRRLRRGDRVLEVGSGRGDFAARLHARGISVTGLELNERAAREALARGLPVRCARLEEVEEAGTFDAVCSFQVLEHVSNPADFLAHCLRLLRPGGRLILGVPDCGGFLARDEEGLLNRPPHHLTWWSAATFRAFARHQGLEVERIAWEPMRRDREGHYCAVQARRLPALPGLRAVACLLLHAALASLRSVGQPVGESLCVSLRKPPTSQGA